MVKAIQKLALMVMALCLMAPITSFAGEWQQNNKGWWVQNDDGTYLTNQWYQSPESGLYYYMGADGYMLVNAITPDGYQVDADGVWVEQPVYQEPLQQSQPVEQPTQSNRTDGLAPGALSKEEVDRRAAEAGLGGAPKGEIVREIHGDKDAGRGYNWQ